MIEPRTITFDPGKQDPEAFADRCEAHESHSPLPKYLEVHHVVPQSWQQRWKPTTSPSPGPGTDGRTLWDNRTVELCRTGHGNVHFWLVRFMKEYANLIPRWPNLNPLARVNAAVVNTTAGQQYHRKERTIAKLAMIRWVEVEGDLKILTDAHQWGGIYGPGG